MLERLFTSKSRVKILNLLIFNPAREFHLREISRITGVSAPYIRHEMKNLIELNLVSESRKGNLVLFKLNRKSPILGELKGILIKTGGVGETLRKGLEKHGILYALIYGSFASGKESESSDIDILIVGDIKEDIVLDIIRKCEHDVGREINYILWSEREFGRRVKERHHLLADIIKKPIIMLLGDLDDFRKSVKRQKD